MDTVLHLERVKRDDTDVSFRITFTKARERTPETRDDFRDVHVALVDNTWTVAGGVDRESVAGPSPRIAAVWDWLP